MTIKVHHLRPAPGAKTAKTRVGRGEGSKGKTAGRGTKGTKARYQVPANFEGGQMPLHMRLPKLRGFRNRFRLEYEIVNVGAISALAETGILDAPELDGVEGAAKPAKAAKPMPVTVTPDILAAAGLIRTLDKPLKVLGQGEVTRPLFILADAFSKTATTKIEAAGGTAQVLEFPGIEDGSEAYSGIDFAAAETTTPKSPASDAGSEA